MTVEAMRDRLSELGQRIIVLKSGFHRAHRAGDTESARALFVQLEAVEREYYELRARTPIDTAGL